MWVKGDEGSILVKGLIILISGYGKGFVLV
jgi:hypothetical protein